MNSEPDSEPAFAGTPREESPAPAPPEPSSVVPGLENLPFRPARRYYQAQAAPAEPPAHRLAKFMVPAVLLAALLAHGLCVNAVFYGEDWTQIVANDAVDGGRWLDTGAKALTYFSHWLTYVLFGMSPTAFHVGNLLIHLALAAGVVGFARDFLVGSAFLPLERARRVGWWAALFFAVHPLGSEVLDYARMRDIELASFFTLLAAWAALRWRRQDKPGYGWPVLTLLGVAGATFCKEVGFLLAAGTAALVFLGTTYTDVRLGRRGVAMPLPGPSTRVKTKLVATPKDAAMLTGNWPVTLSLALVGACLSLAAWPAWLKAYQALHHPRLGWHALTKARVFWMYLQRAVLPVNLCNDHYLPWTVGLGDAVAWLSAVGELGVIVLAVWLYFRRSGPARAVGTLLCIILLDLVHRLANPDASLMVESRMYPALVPICILLAWGLDRLCGLRGDEKTSRRPLLAAYAVGALVVAGVVLSALRAQVWSNTRTLVHDVLAQYPLQFAAWQEIQEADVRAHYRSETLKDQDPIRAALEGSLIYNTHSPERKYFPGPLLLAHIRSEGNVALALASLGRRHDAANQMEWIKKSVPNSGEIAAACQAEYLYMEALVNEAVHHPGDAMTDLAASYRLTGNPEALRALRRVRLELKNDGASPTN